jgi:hypothetical protein
MTTGVGFTPWNLVGSEYDPLGRSLFGSPQQFSPDPQSTQLANLSMQQWQQAAQMMYPAEQRLIQYAEDPNYIANQRAQAASDSSNAFNAQLGARNRLMALQGINPTAAQSAALDRQTALARAQAQAGAMNQATGLAAQTQQAVLQGVK